MPPQMRKPRQPFGHRINDWLQEPQGETFRQNKWMFWLLPMVVFQILNATLSAMVFSTGGHLQSYIGGIILAVGALLAWLTVAFLHYSDGHDRALARGVAGLDSATLIFAVIHLGFLLWVFGHISTLQSQEASYKTDAETYNARAERMYDGRVKIAQAEAQAAQENAKRARLESDAAFQLRKAAEAGGARGIPRPAPNGQNVQSAAAVSVAPITLERPDKPKQSSAEFLTTWDALIRLANIMELLLAGVTLIYIRNRSAKTNTAPSAPRRVVLDLDDEPFPAELDTRKRVPPRPENLRTKKETTKNHGSFSSLGLKRLRETLRDISFRLKGYSFKSAIRGDAVWIYLMKANNSTQEATHSAKATLQILNDAESMPRAAFQERLERFLRDDNGFPI